MPPPPYDDFRSDYLAALRFDYADGALLMRHYNYEFFAIKRHVPAVYGLLIF